jgi:hypothetical protein
MITGYESLLRVTEDGNIWWVLKAAIRLGAGYRPYSDDNRNLEPELRATSKRALANERTLIGAFGDARLTIEQPMTFERDGFRYVDAEGFLDWLSQYITQTQAKITFPDELASEVRKTKAKAAASCSPVSGQKFESLTLALEGWFDKKLDALPIVLRERVEREISPAPWGDLSADARRTVTLHLDYLKDPAAEQDRKFWWEFFERMGDLEKQIAKWKSAATPTATDILLKESRLNELQQELGRMQLQQRQARDEYSPGRQSLDADKGIAPNTDYIAFPKAMKILADRLRATPEELAAWIFMGPDTGGIVAYRNANELNPPPRFYFDCFMGEDYLSPLMACWFRQDDIDRFDPADRYITGAALIDRWSTQPGFRPEALIRAKIAESRLLDIHPTFGGTRGTHDDDTNFPPLSAGLFAMNHIEQVEAEDGLEAVMSIAQLAAEPHGSPIDAYQATLPTSNNGDPCAAFREMDDLRPNEIAIAIVGDVSDAGLTGNGLLEISARGVTRRLALAEFGLVDRRSGALNKQAAVLVGLAQGVKMLRSEEKHAATMTRLRAEFRDRMGVKADPFSQHSPQTGWQPLFTIVDLRGRADERAREAAERPGRTVSLNQLEDMGLQFAATADDEPDGDVDEADRWLDDHDPDRAA